MRQLALLGLALWFGILARGIPASAAPAILDSPRLRLTLAPETGRYEILDKRAAVSWRSNPSRPRFGEVTLNVAGQRQIKNLDHCEATRNGDSLELAFHPLEANLPATLRVTLKLLPSADTLEFSYAASPPLEVESIRLLDEALWVTDSAKGYAVVPVREGLLVPADSGLAFSHRFGTYDYEGCHMAMAGLVQSNAAVLLSWSDPYLALELKSVLTNAPGLPGTQVLLPSLSLRKSAQSFRLQFLGPGNYVTLAQAYRQLAAEKGWLVKWDEKLKDHPERAKYFGASNFKLWSTLHRSMNETSTREERVGVSWTFDEAAQVAEHLKNDLKLDRVLFILGGWIHRGYDNQHPDILPTAPECGGDTAFADCARRVRGLGYLLCLHDNYQDIYRDSPSWNEDYIMKNRDGTIMQGGKWAGGRAYLTCSQKAVELAKRPQNLPAVRKLSGADSYFIDTTYAAGLMECFDQHHPLTKLDDMKWKQAISDYAREVFGSFGSECGREWAIPHADFFEGLTGVSGAYYHNKDLPKQLGAVVVPLFEIVYRDCIAMYGKYGYDPMQATEYVAHHIAIGRPLNYHSIPSHLYWKEPARDGRPLPLAPAVAECAQTAPQQFAITYRWTVSGPVKSDWPVFVHFTDAQGKILFQNDHAASPSMDQWKPGEVLQGPFKVTVPAGLEGTFDIRLGMFNRNATGSRAALLGKNDGEHRYLLGKIKVRSNLVEFLPPTGKTPSRPPMDLGLFCRADHGWAEGMHPMDRFVKNTHEILSPLNEITARLPMTQHQFLTPDRKVQRSVFGDGTNAVEVVVNIGTAEYRHSSKLGGEVVLPPYGFVAEAPGFAAFHALSWDGVSYQAPAMFTLRSLDGQPLQQSKRVRVFHAFGDMRVKVAQSTRTVEKEAVVEAGK